MRSLGLPLLTAALLPFALGFAARSAAQGTQPSPAPFMIVPGQTPATPPPPAAPAATPVPEAPAPAAVFGFKPLLPAARVALEGENDVRNWAFFLTQDDVTADPSLDIAFQNALVVMPEVSRMTVRINGERVVEVPIASSDRPKSMSTALRKGLLKAGQNTISFEAFQRHRTDCTIASTYELWTRIDGAGTRLSFRNPATRQSRLRALDDLPAVGADENGRTTIIIVAPGAARATAANSIFAVSQALTLRGRYGQVAVEVTEQLPARIRPGTLTVALGTGDEMRALLGTLPAEAAGRSFLGFIPNPRNGPELLLATGETAPDLDALVERLLVAPVSRPTNIARKTMDTARWHMPEAPFVSDTQVLRFSELGVPTRESSGRRMRVRAVVAMPGDFYANAYGEATLYLDGAYSNEILPGDSHIEIFVNGNVAATVPLNTVTGGLLRQFPITVPLRHFRPGVNEIWFEAVTPTKSDQACGPGATLPGKSRFALFDTTALSIPNFAKIGMSPNLAAVVGTGFPYSAASRVALVIGRQDNANLSAAATVLARIAQRANRPLAIDLVAGTAAAGDRPVLIVGAAAQLPAGLLARVGVAENVRATWPARADAVVVTPDTEGTAIFDAVIDRLQGRQATPEASGGPTPTTEAVRDRWRNSLSGPIARYFIGFDQWLQRTFDLSIAQLRTPSRAPALYEPAEGTELIAAQAADPDNRQVWTAFIARREEALESTVDRVVSPGNWAAMAGKITAYRGAQEAHVISADQVSFVMTRPFSLANMRLVLANWMSSNIGIYALALLLACIGLGIGTWAMIGRLGRRS